jgi:hypothetical protein
VQLLLALRATGGEVAYPLDDAYIHLAMAKTLVQHGVWGIHEHAFSSSSSSPLWLLVLAAGIWSLGDATWLPLALASSTALVLLFVVDRIWRRLGIAAAPRALGLGALVLAVPLSTLALTGMEHCLHALLAVLFVERAATALAAGPGEGRRAGAAAVLVAPFLVAARFEGLFLVAPAALLFWRRLGLRPAVLLGATAALPVLALGLLSWSQGHFFLPNSIALKAGDVPVPGLSPARRGVLSGIRAVTGHGHAGTLLLAAAWAAWRIRRHQDARLRAPLLCFATGLVLHAYLARFGWFFRYEAYLIVLGIAAVVPAAVHAPPAGSRGVRLLGWFVLLFCIGAFAHRSWRALKDPPNACRHTFLQNVQVGRFLAAHCQGQAVAVNDIGAVSWLGGVRAVDLVGLADIEVARQRRARGFDAAFVDRLARSRGVRLAVVYANWFPDQLPAHWQRIGAWTVERPFWSPTVTFFAADADAAAPLREALAGFGRGLPSGVQVE